MAKASDRKKIIEGLWDCPYCSEKGIGGLTKVCPNCGHPQDAGTKFYLPDAKDYKYLDEEKSKNYGKGADWICPFCGGYNRYDATECANCGADKTVSEGDYFSEQNDQKIKQREEELKPATESTRTETSGGKKPQKEQKQTKSKKKSPLPFILLAVLALAIYFFMPKNYKAEISDKSWERSISIEEYKTVAESDWSVPDGGRVTDKKQEIHHYDQVLDHYEEVEVQKSRQVQNGYDTETYTVNNGDGTFSEETREVPHYETEYYTETESRPVYKDVPVYKTKYYYDIERWIETRTVDSAGDDSDPYWEDTDLSSKEREGERSEKYVLEIAKKKKIYEYETSQEEWEDYEIGDKVEMTISGGSVTKIKHK